MRSPCIKSRLERIALEFGLDITAPDLKAELEKELDPAKVKEGRKIPGFEDFSPDGKRALPVDGVWLSKGIA